MPQDKVAKARYTLLKGQFYVFFEEDPDGGPEPDGDTVRFIPDDPFRVLPLRRFGGNCVVVNDMVKSREARCG
jgi:hypothetical protein